jgi:hypothetical protein
VPQGPPAECSGNCGHGHGHAPGPPAKPATAPDDSGSPAPATPPSSRRVQPTDTVTPVDVPESVGEVSAGGAEDTVVHATTASLGGKNGDGSDSGLAALPFTGLALFCFAFTGLAMLGLGAPLRRLAGAAARR